MTESRQKSTTVRQPSPFERTLPRSGAEFTRIGKGEIGGKASGLSFAKTLISEQVQPKTNGKFRIDVPGLTILGTGIFDAFMKHNRLWELPFEELSDDRIAHAFQQADLPAEFTGDLWALIDKVHTPLAVRSSSLLEDAMYRPFAGIYGTKMTPNNQNDTKSRFIKLIEAIKFVFASTFFKDARDYIRGIGRKSEEEKMAVIIQEVVGSRHDNLFYPLISGVARSYNFYPVGNARPEHGIGSLALGLGRSIVDEGVGWNYSPAFPKSPPPYGTIDDLLKMSQRKFWAINMGKPAEYNPVRETEYMEHLDVDTAENSGALRLVASTYIAESDRLYPGTGRAGPRVLNFAPILELSTLPLNDAVKLLLSTFEDTLETKVEIEFALSYDQRSGETRLGFLQVRPMVVSEEVVELSLEDMQTSNTLVASESVLGNGTISAIRDIVFVRPDRFEPQHSRQIAAEVEKLNFQLFADKIPYLLIGFGRWGSADPWLGIPVNWGQICGAKVIVEATLPNINVDLSQGSHFFHNISSFQISYFSVSRHAKHPIDWHWLETQPVADETGFVKHIRLTEPIKVQVDGRTGRGVIKR